MSFIARDRYRALYGPTAGDRVRLADTDLWIEVTDDLCAGGDEVVFGGGKVIGESMGQSTRSRADGARDLVITGAIILPWHENPTRVAEKISMLQVMLGDRFLLGFGRGLAREEYRAFGVDMSTARERFDTAADIILDILDTGIAEYDTPFFKQSRTTVTPKPEHGYRDREFFSVAMTPDSGVAAANLGGTMMSFVQLPWEQHSAAVDAWRARFREVHPDKTPGAPVFSDFTFCHLI